MCVALLQMCGLPQPLLADAKAIKASLVGRLGARPVAAVVSAGAAAAATQLRLACSIVSRLQPLATLRCAVDDPATSASGGTDADVVSVPELRGILAAARREHERALSTAGVTAGTAVAAATHVAGRTARGIMVAARDPAVQCASTDGPGAVTAAAAAGKSEAHPHGDPNARGDFDMGGVSANAGAASGAAAPARAWHAGVRRAYGDSIVPAPTPAVGDASVQGAVRAERRVSLKPGEEMALALDNQHHQHQQKEGEEEEEEQYMQHGQQCVGALLHEQWDHVLTEAFPLAHGTPAAAGTAPLQARRAEAAATGGGAGGHQAKQQLDTLPIQAQLAAADQRQPPSQAECASSVPGAIASRAEASGDTFTGTPPRVGDSGATVLPPTTAAVPPAGLVDAAVTLSLAKASALAQALQGLFD
jgi:hypothetical protein